MGERPPDRLAGGLARAASTECAPALGESPSPATSHSPPASQRTVSASGRGSQTPGCHLCDRPDCRSHAHRRKRLWAAPFRDRRQRGSSEQAHANRTWADAGGCFISTRCSDHSGDVVSTTRRRQGRLDECHPRLLGGGCSRADPDDMTAKEIPGQRERESRRAASAGDMTQTEGGRTARTSNAREGRQRRRRRPCPSRP